MHFTTLSVACFVALASAHSNHAHHFHMRRALNATVPSTTLIVYATETKTILSCAAIVTDCPAHPEQATSEVVVTETKAIYTTICPVADASSISSAIISGVTPAPIAPLSTGSGPVVTTPVKDSGSSDTVLTYTLGTGTSTTVVTTTIKHTETKTIYATPTSEITQEEGEGGYGDDDEGETGEPSPSETSDSSGEGSEEPTTTLSSTSTHTKYVTVYPAPTGVNGGGDCAPVAPVTVTVAATTVTVVETKTEKEVATCPTPIESAPLDEAAVPSATSAQDGIGGSPTDTPSDVVVVPTTATLIPVPISSISSAPYGNGTYPTGGASPTVSPTVLPTGGYEYKHKA